VRRGWPQHTVLVLILALAAGARAYGLSAQLWVDEIDALRYSIRRPILSIATEWPGSTPHVLADLAAHVSVRAFGEAPWTVRLPAALFGLGGVVLLYLVGRQALGERVGLLAAALMAVWAPHVFQSQNARGYTALLFFALLASLLFLRGLPAAGWTGTGYVLAAALAAYALFFGAVIVPAHLLAAGVVAGAAAPWRPLVLRAAASLGLAALLYAPLGPSVVAFVRGHSLDPAAACAAHSAWLSPVGLLREGVLGLAEGFGGPAGLALALSAAAVGLVPWARRHPLSLAVLALPVALQGLLAAAFSVPLNPRYFVLALPVLLLAMGQGLATALDAAASRMPQARGLAAAAVGAVIVAWAWPLAHYYRTPKQDFLGAAQRVQERAAAGDMRVAVHLAGHVLRGHYGAPFRHVDTLDELAAAESEGRRVWLVTTLERHLQVVRPDLHGYIRTGYHEWARMPATVRDAEMRLYVREPPAGR
jgi:4-amino-4-deoxy-L-arabinose transferase-like glycosyltransferase